MLLKFNYNVSFAGKNYHNILSQWFAKKKNMHYPTITKERKTEKRQA